MTLNPTRVQQVTAFNSAPRSAREAAKRTVTAAQLWSAPPYQAGTGKVITLVAAGAHYVPDQYWEAGRTSAPPTPPTRINFTGATVDFGLNEITHASFTSLAVDGEFRITNVGSTNLALATAYFVLTRVGTTITFCVGAPGGSTFDITGSGTLNGYFDAQSNILDEQGEYWYDDIQLDPAGAAYVSTHGAESGHAWPYMSPGPLLESQDPGDPGVGLGRWYPACIQNQGINHYRRGFPFRRWMFGRRAGRFHIQLAGTVEVADATNPTREHMIEFVMAPVFGSAWNAGDGGTTLSPGQFASNRTFGFRTPSFTYNDLLLNGDPTAPLFYCDIWGMSVYRGISFWTADMALCLDGLSTPIFSTRRNFFFSTTAINFDVTDGNMAFLFKFDGKSPTTQLITYSSLLSGDFEAGDAVSKGGITGTVISHDSDNSQILVGRINNQDFGTSGSLNNDTQAGEATISASTDEYQPFGKINNAAWSAAPAANKWPPNVPQDGAAGKFLCDYFSVDFHSGL